MCKDYVVILSFKITFYSAVGYDAIFVSDLFTLAQAFSLYGAYTIKSSKEANFI